MQVVHHPTILAAYAEGRQWTFEGEADLKSKFWGRSIELTPVGILKLTFHDGEAFTWSKVRAGPLQCVVLNRVPIDRHGTLIAVAAKAAAHGQGCVKGSRVVF